MNTSGSFLLMCPIQSGNLKFVGTCQAVQEGKSTYAHSKEEQIAWNGELRQRGKRPLPPCNTVVPKRSKTSALGGTVVILQPLLHLLQALFHLLFHPSTDELDKWISHISNV